MKLKTFIFTAGLSAAAGAAAVLMMPKDTKAYKTATEAADKLKTEAERMIDTLKM